VRHEQTAVFAAEATARLTRTPGLAVLTAGPGVTNGVSAVTTAYFNGSPVVVLAGRAPDYRWGSGSLQEFDHPALLAPITKRAWTEHETAKVGSAVDDAFRLASTAHYCRRRLRQLRLRCSRCRRQHDPVDRPHPRRRRHRNHHLRRHLGRLLRRRQHRDRQQHRRRSDLDDDREVDRRRLTYRDRLQPVDHRFPSGRSDPERALLTPSCPMT